MEQMTKEQYMEMLNWDQSLYKIISGEEAEPLLKIGGHQNYVYAVSPKGEKAFGKGSKVVKIDWAEKHSAPAVEQTPAAAIPPPPANIPPAPAAASIPPPPATEAAIPPPPAQEEKPVEDNSVYELRLAQLKSIGWNQVSDNVLERKDGKRVSNDYLKMMNDDAFMDLMKAPLETPKEEPVKEEVKQAEPAWEPYIKTRVANLISQGWKADQNGNSVVISPEGKYYGFMEIGELSNKDYTDLIKKPEVPAEIKEIADASPNVHIVTMPKDDEPTAEDIAKEKANKLLQIRRIALSALGFTNAPGAAMWQSDINHNVSDKEVIAMGEDEFKDFLKLMDGKIVTVKAQKASEDRQAKNEEIRKQKEAEQSNPDVGVEIANEAAEVAEKSINEMANETEGMSAVELDEHDVRKLAIEQAQKRDDAEIDKYEAEKKMDELMEKLQKENDAHKEQFEKWKQDLIAETEAEKKKIREEYQQKESPMTTGDAGGFFGLLAELGFGQLNLSVTKLESNKFSVIVKPQNFSGDPALDEIRPMTLSGSPAELDEGFFAAISQPLQKVHGVMSNAQAVIADLEEKAKKTKAAEEEKKKVTKAVEKAKKHHDDKDFDAKSDASLKTAKKNWDAVLALDPGNKDAKAGLDKLEKQIKENAETLL